MTILTFIALWFGAQIAFLVVYGLVRAHQKRNGSGE